MRTFGIPGILGALLLAIWLVGFVGFGIHSGYFHLLVLAGGLLLVGQGVRRINADD